MQEGWAEGKSVTAQLLLTDGNDSEEEVTRLYQAGALLEATVQAVLSAPTFC